MVLYTNLAQCRLHFFGGTPIYFSIAQRKVRTPLDVADKTTLTKRLLGFQDYYQETAKPFSWKFPAADLKRRLDALQELFVQPGFTLKTYETVV